MKKLFILTASLMLFTSGIYADVKVATVDFNKSVQNSKQVTMMKQMMENKFSSRHKKIETDRSAIKKEIAQLQRNESTMSKSNLQKNKQSIQGKVTKLEKLEREYQRDVMAFRSTQFNEMVKSFKQAVSKIAQHEGVSMVINQSAVVYHQSAVKDITAEVANQLK